MHARTLAEPADAGAEGRLGASLASFWVAAFAASAVILLVLLLLLALLASAHEERMVDRQLIALSEVLAHELESRTGAVRAQLERWRDDPGLQQVLTQGSADLLRAKEQELVMLIPGAIGVSLLTADEASPGGDAARRLSYAGVDLVHQVLETGAVSPLEAHRVKQEDEHLAIAGPVMDASGERLLGVVHLMLPLSLLPTAGDLDAGNARFQFRQRVEQEYVEVDARRSGQMPPGAPRTRLPVDDTSLVLFAWGDAAALLSGRHLLPWLAALYAAGLALLALALWLPYRRQRQGIDADLAFITALADDAANRRPPRSARTRIAEFRAVQETLRRVLRDLTAPRVVTSRTEADLAALAGPPEADGETMELEFDAGLDLGTEGAAGSDAAATPPSADAAPPPAADVAPLAPPAASTGIFRAYDIRGLVGSEITADVMRSLGRAVGSEARERGNTTCIVGRDQRPSGESLSAALVDGLRASGVDVIDLGIAPTPLVYFASQLHGGCSAAVVTASHNPARYNGLKVVLDGRSATSSEIAALRERVEAARFSTGDGGHTEASVVGDYVAEVQRDVAIARPMKIVVDCGHATASLVAGRLFRALDCEVVELDCELDPELADQRMPDPAKPANLQGLGEAVKAASADLGLGFDADSDRLGVVDSAGRYVDIDRVLMLLAADVLARLPGSDIVYDVKCSHHLGKEIVRNGGRPVMWRSGHSHLKEKMRELGAPLGGELSGHIAFTERWNGFDDAFYAGARLLEVLALDPRSTAEIFAELPSAAGTPELFVPLPPGEDQQLMRTVLGMADRLDGVEVNTIDGLRAEFDHGWGLVRASNTQPGLVFRFQADDEESLEKIKDLFRRMMRLVESSLELPF